MRNPSSRRFASLVLSTSAVRWLSLVCLPVLGCLGALASENTPPPIDADGAPSLPSTSSSSGNANPGFDASYIDASEGGADSSLPDVEPPGWDALVDVPVVVSNIVVPSTFTTLDAFAARNGRLWLGSGYEINRVFVTAVITKQGEVIEGVAAGSAGLGRVVVAHGSAPRAYVMNYSGSPPVLLGSEAPLAFCSSVEACVAPETCALGADVVGLGELAGGEAVAVTSAGFVYMSSSVDGTCLVETDHVEATLAFFGFGARFGQRLFLPINEIVANAHRALSIAPDGTADIVSVTLVDKNSMPSRLVALAPELRDRLFAEVMGPTEPFLQDMRVGPDGAGNLVQGPPADTEMYAGVDVGTAEYAGGRGATFHTYWVSSTRAAALDMGPGGIAHDLPANADLQDYHLSGDDTRFWQAVYCPHGVGATSMPVVRVEGRLWTTVTASNTANAMTSCNP